MGPTQSEEQLAFEDFQRLLGQSQISRSGATKSLERHFDVLY